MGYGYIRERPREPEPSAKPQITSFADVTLVLLVIFLVSASAAVEMVALTLPEAERTVSRDVNLAVTISIAKETKKPGAAAAKDQASSAPATTTAPTTGPGAKKPKKYDPWRFYFEDEKAAGIEAKNLWTALKAIKSGNPWPLALIRADKNVPSEHVAILIQCLQGLGVDEIAFQMKGDEDKDGPVEDDVD